MTDPEITQHSFDIRLAEAISVNAAIIYQNLVFWIAKNKSNNKHFYDGKYWTYNSVSAFKNLFPYMGLSQINKALKDLESNGLVVTGNYNKSSYDRTKWYSINDFTHLLKIKNGLLENVNTIPDINTDINTYIDKLSEIKISDDPALIDLDISLYQDQRNILITKSFFDLFRKNQMQQGVTTFTQYDKTKLKTWLIHVDRMLNIDGITPDTLLAIYKWLLTDKFRNAEFWRKNILSTAKLREQMPKLQLAMFDDMKTLEKEIEKTKANQRDQSRLGI